METNHVEKVTFYFYYNQNELYNMEIFYCCNSLCN